MTGAADLFAKAENYRVEMRIAEAPALYDTAEKAGYDPNQCGAARWTCYMLAGDWERAWRESDKISRRGSPDPNRYWDGSSWAGKDVLIRCLHGLGDTLHFIRYAALIRKQARSLTVEAQPPLKSLLQHAGLADQVITWGDPEPEWQVQLEVNELPRAFRTTLKTVPSHVPYLASGKNSIPLNTDSRLRVGIVWAASSFDVTRNVPLELLESILHLPHFAFYSLQGGEGWTASLPVVLTNLISRETSIENVADQIAGLDLVLTVDTMVAHLAGALGRATWTMLPFVCDWRWMAGQETTPWYPTMRLFRQPSPGNWNAVLELVRAALLAHKMLPGDCISASRGSRNRADYLVV